MMEIDIILTIIILARIIAIHAIVSTFILIKGIASTTTKVIYTCAALVYLYYVSLNSVTTIPHTFNDLIRVVSVATLFYIASKHIRRE